MVVVDRLEVPFRIVGHAVSEGDAARFHAILEAEIVEHFELRGFRELRLSAGLEPGRPVHVFGLIEPLPFVLARLLRDESEGEQDTHAKVHPTLLVDVPRVYSSEALRSNAASFAGARRAAVLSPIMRSRALALVIVIVVVGGVCLAACSRPKRPLNLILVSVDTLRADYLSCYGGESVATPSFDRIAREGVLFENASTVAPSTLPAHASLLTGETPLRHWVHDNVGFRLREDVPTLASTLKQAGYRTGGFVGSFVLDRKFGLGRGFDVYSDEMPEIERGLPERRGAAVLEDALGWIEPSTRSGDPFFAFIHFYDPHRPYDPPPPFNERATDEKSQYAGEVAYVDSLLGKLLDFLDSHGLSDSTVVIVTADHGESLGEHGESTHSFFLYQSTLHVPLLIRAPSLPGGRRVSSLVRIIDVAPTALEILGVPAPASIEGVSFLSATGEVRDRDVEAYAETFVPRLNHGWSELRSLRRRNWKLILAPRSELYDLDSDPLEARNRIQEERGPADALREKLDELVAGETVHPERGRRENAGVAARSRLCRAGSSTVPAAARPSSELPDPKDEIATYNEILDLSAIVQPSPDDIARLEKLLESEPDDPSALSIYGNFLLEARRPRDAQKTFEHLADSRSRQLRRDYGLGRADFDLGELDGALASFEKARDIDPESANVYSRLAKIEKARGNLDASEKWLREGMRIAPSRIAFQDLADFLLASGRGGEIQKLAGGWHGPGAEAAAAYGRGQLLFSQGNPAGALVELERAAELAPEDDNIEQALANSLSQLGRFEEAKVHYETILRRTPCYLGALTNLGAVYERQKRADDAIRSYENAIRCDDRYPAAYRNLGAALARKGELPGGDRRSRESAAPLSRTIES